MLRSILLAAFAGIVAGLTSFAAPSGAAGLRIDTSLLQNAASSARWQEARWLRAHYDDDDDDGGRSYRHARRHHRHGEWHRDRGGWRPDYRKYPKRYRPHRQRGDHGYYRVPPRHGGYDPRRHAAPWVPSDARCGSQRLIGALLGAAGGGFIGSKFGSGDGQLAAVAGGTVLGMFLGHEVGAALAWSDAACAQQAVQRAYDAPLGSEIRWNNPQTGHRGKIAPLRDGTSATGAYCREFQQTVVIGGRSESAYGIACRQPDGSWEMRE